VGPYYSTLAIGLVVETVISTVLLLGLAEIIKTLVNIENGVNWRNWNQPTVRVEQDLGGSPRVDSGA
ncbi:MAG: hypothetical protein ACREAC_07960, partial [Blastocatellia bacterium]